MQLHRETLMQRFGDVWPVHHRGFSNLLIECRRLFDGDMDQLKILTVIGDRTLTMDRSKGLTYPEFSKGRRGISDIQHFKPLTFYANVIVAASNNFFYIFHIIKPDLALFRWRNRRRKLKEVEPYAIRVLETRRAVARQQRKSLRFA